MSNVYSFPVGERDRKGACPSLFCCWDAKVADMLGGREKCAVVTHVMYVRHLPCSNTLISRA